MSDREHSSESRGSKCRPHRGPFPFKLSKEINDKKKSEGNVSETIFHVSKHITQYMERLILYFTSVSVTHSHAFNRGRKDLNAGLGLI